MLSLQLNRSLHFLDDRSPQRPFFIMLSPPAPHSPWTAAPQYEKNFADVKAPRDGSFDKPGKDKHWLLRQPSNPMPSTSLNFLDNAYRKRYNSQSNNPDTLFIIHPANQITVLHRNKPLIILTWIQL